MAPIPMPRHVARDNADGNAHVVGGSEHGFTGDRMLERLLAELRVARLASARIVALSRPGLAAALDALGISTTDRVLGTVADRRAWAALLERIEGRDLAGERTSIPSGPLSDAFRAYVKAKDAPFDHDVLKRAPGVQLMMLERLEQVTTRRTFRR